MTELTPRDQAQVTYNLDALSERRFADVGFDARQQRVYIALLRTGGASASELATTVGASRREVALVLARLEDSAMVTHTPNRSRRYFAVPPDIAIEALIAQRRRQAEEQEAAARALVGHLDALSRSEHRGNESDRVVEILSREAAHLAFLRMRQSAEAEILCLERSPILLPEPGPDLLLLETKSRGVNTRTIVARELLRKDGQLERMRFGEANGERYRIAASLPFKLVLSDKRLAILPLNLSAPEGAVLLVRTSSLLDALCEMFELLWRNSAPHREKKEEGGLIEDTELVGLLVSGLADKEIAHRLHVSHRTITRRVAELMRAQGASSRFQAGWQYAQTKTFGDF